MFTGIRVDKKGRIMLPRSLREKIRADPATICFWRPSGVKSSCVPSASKLL